MNLKKMIALTSTLVVLTTLLLLNTRSEKTIKPKTNAEIASTTAMITNTRGNSGGTGVILTSSKMKSTILTNAHVCGVVRNGGMIYTDSKRSAVVSYKVSETHDLCLITTNSNLQINTKIADDAPNVYDEATVSGHPLLLPTVITRGTFSDKEIINVLTGMRKCEESEMSTNWACRLLGFLPVVRAYESQVTSATIQPGSSGSAVFNGEGEISGLIFAGNGVLSYGHLVPLEYIRYFVDVELNYLKQRTPDSNDSPELESEQKLRKICKSDKSSEEYIALKDYCEYFIQDLLY